MNQLPAFSFLWPRMLWLLALVPILAALYLWLNARRRRAAVHYPALMTVGVALTGGAGWRRHVPPALILLGVTALIVAVARPQAIMMLPSRIETVILAMDLSGSMRAQDIKPSRIGAAQQAAKTLLDAQPAGVSVGVVAMAGTAAVAQAPSRNKKDVATVIDHLQPQAGTALGGGLIIALATLLPRSGIDVTRLMNPDDPTPPPKSANASRKAPGRAFGSASGAASDGLAVSGGVDTVAPASYASGAIVLFSDGESNAGPDTMKAAQVAADHGVRIYTVGIGTTEGAVLSVDGWSARVKLDEEVLKKIADTTGAEYFRIEDTDKLKSVYRALNARLAFDKRDQIEITALFAALGALLAACAGLLSLWWFGRVL